MTTPGQYGIIYNWDGAPHGYSTAPQSLDEFLQFTYAPLIDTQVGALFWCVGEHAARWSSTALEQRALAVTRYLGLSPRFGAGSTDANVPIARGVPAVAIGRGGTGGGAHSLDEWWAPVLPNIAVQRALLLLVTSAGVVE